MKKETKNKNLQNDIANANKKKKSKVVDNSKKQKENYDKIASEQFLTSGILCGFQNCLFNSVSITSEQKQIDNNIKQNVKKYNEKAKQNNAKTTNYKTILLQNKQVDEQTKILLLVYNNLNIVNCKDITKEQTNQLKQIFSDINKTQNNFKNEIDLIKAKASIYITKEQKNQLQTIFNNIFKVEYALSFNDIRKIYANAYNLKQKTIK